VRLVHPGGPFWRNKRVGARQIPKGLIEPDEDPIQAALRETEEELGTRFDDDTMLLVSVTHAGGKYVVAFALRSDFNVATLASNDFEMEWPPRSGKHQRFPEVDEARWFTMAHARTMMLTR
jgi:predicted NUDIX family NTP pyrophosphohydrolase